MIEKLDRLQGRDIYENTALAKINEIIDLLNAIVVDVDGIKCIDGSKKVERADQYAEQRKWIGKICKFWDNDDIQPISYGVLTAINTDFGVQYWCNDEYEYDDCQPVKPDDNIIYKGE